MGLCGGLCYTRRPRGGVWSGAASAQKHPFCFPNTVVTRIQLQDGQSGDNGLLVGFPGTGAQQGGDGHCGGCARRGGREVSGWV